MNTQFQPGQHIHLSSTGETYEILAQEGVWMITKNLKTGYRRNFTLVEIVYQNAQVTPIKKNTAPPPFCEKSQSLRRGNKLIKSTHIVACVDDSKSVQLQVKKTLEMVGYRVLNITEPTAALTVLAHYQPVLILMDINMPELNGFELCKILQRSRKLKNIPIVMLTSEEGIMNRLRAKWLGVLHYLKKPFEPQQLIEVVNHLVKAKFPSNIKDKS